MIDTGIRVSKLPTSFREAICVARGLGISYVWIDSLCIIQDDKEDWKAEARRMAIIYDNATLTIAANDGLNSHAGLIVHNPDLQSVNTLDSRAWVCQERMVSPRSLIFTEGSAIWECRECDASIDKPELKARRVRGVEETPTHPKDIFAFFRDWRLPLKKQEPARMIQFDEQEEGSQASRESQQLVFHGEDDKSVEDKEPSTNLQGDQDQDGQSNTVNDAPSEEEIPENDFEDQYKKRLVLTPDGRNVLMQFEEFQVDEDDDNESQPSRESQRILDDEVDDKSDDIDLEPSENQQWEISFNGRKYSIEIDLANLAVVSHRSAGDPDPDYKTLGPVLLPGDQNFEKAVSQVKDIVSAFPKLRRGPLDYIIPVAVRDLDYDSDGFPAYTGGLPGHAANLGVFLEGATRSIGYSNYPQNLREGDPDPFGDFLVLVTDLDRPQEDYFPFLRTWWSFLSNYSSLSLTFGSDKFLAINGITNVAQRWTHLRPAFGLFWHFMEMELLWSEAGELASPNMVLGIDQKWESEERRLYPTANAGALGSTNRFLLSRGGPEDITHLT
ncbi:uncharacterized protein ColSpa_03158 [Colletotrichum spaethianum]|uniref:Heterokaryon incompatibility domain-containing protein n=1 Tax=Colletotrichum spaethianum TaxID=700344 RepID=A0AA37L6Y2_9PEZI|nr:uncharacterized protein ColSpa_03158 [Colletotrichum spaethianum]GKT42977.1 hypothetical protein ColSpa_03158 [Colletotrichum spaethianum]